MIEETGVGGRDRRLRLARRLAIAFWKGERAERIEVALFDAAPGTTRMNGYRQEEADPLTTFDLRRFNAVRGQQGQIGREISRCLKELPHAQKGSAGRGHGRTRQRVGKGTRARGTGQRRRGGRLGITGCGSRRRRAKRTRRTGSTGRPPSDQLAAYLVGLQQAIRAEMDALVERDEAEPDTTRLDELTYALCRSRLRAAAGG